MGITLAVLNACETARHNTRDALMGVAQALIREEIPAVIAMQFLVSETVALMFTRRLYEFLFRGDPLEKIVTELGSGSISIRSRTTSRGAFRCSSCAPKTAFCGSRTRSTRGAAWIRWSQRISNPAPISRRPAGDDREHLSRRRSIASGSLMSSPGQSRMPSAASTSFFSGDRSRHAGRKDHDGRFR